MRPIRLAMLSAAVLGACGMAAAAAQADDLPPWLAIHGQATLTAQATPGFRSPYAGDNSLTPDQAKETIDATAFIGVRPWRGGEAWVDPEIDQGFGLSNTLGVAGFPSAEAYKVGKAAPYLRLQRLFFRQTVRLGGSGSEQVEADQNAFGGRRPADRLVVTVGKFGVGDVFDTNRYAHDPRGDLLNWTLVDAGSFDYAADAWGYSTGIAVEAWRGAWTLRAGLFNLSRIPNGERLERGFAQYQLDGEIEHRQTIAGRPGAVRVTVFRNRGRFARYADALAAAAQTGLPPELAPLRRRRTRAGADINLEQELAADLGLFARAGFADGSIEPYDFTDVDRSLSAGVAIGGARWGRPRDGIGIAVVVNAISTAHQRYLAAGGLGVLVGDGRLPRPGDEAIGELYYRWVPVAPVAVTLDYQLIGNPGYNRQRGPVNVFGLRLHGEF